MESPRGGGDGAASFSWMQVSLALMIALAATAYTIAVLVGKVDRDHQINGAHLAVLVAAAVAIVLLLRPRV
ncbi:MAG TPA: hypothetical protein VF832_00190, partial [Longimicrobiales bacterium]